jgi:hypothetical protein
MASMWLFQLSRYSTPTRGLFFSHVVSLATLAIVLKVGPLDIIDYRERVEHKEQAVGTIVQVLPLHMRNR